MRMRPVLTLAAPIGILAGHAAGHLIAPGTTHGHPLDHGYLAAAATVAASLALLSVAWAGARGKEASRPVPAGALVAAQCVLFAGQEAVEHALAGNGPLVYLGSPALWAGLVAQVATAVVLCLVLRGAAAAGARLAGALPWAPAVAGLPVFGSCLAVRPRAVAAGLATPCLSRGPPVLPAT